MHARSISLSLVVPAALFFTGAFAHAQTFNCSSTGQYRTCKIPGNTRNTPVQMVRQLSQAPCVQGRSWGMRNDNQIWVDRGCSAVFQVNGPGNGGPGYGGGRPPYAPPNQGPGWNRPPTYYSGSFKNGRSRCSSAAGAGRTYCQSGGAFKYANPVGVNNRCVQNRTWGSSQYGLWVADGCSGEWEIKR